MLRKQRKKSQSQRGTNSHGWGHKKKHRGSGHRGGFGLAGTGARGDVKKSAVLNNSKSVRKIIAAQKGVKISKVKLGRSYFGKRGFTSIYKSTQKTLSVSYIETQYDSLVKAGAIAEDKKEIVFNATEYGIDKILGKAKLSRKLTVIVPAISESAKKSIEEVGGKVEGLEASDDFDEDFEESSEEE